MLSSQPIVAWRNVALPGRDGAEPRGLLTLQVAVDGTDVIVGCTHLQNRSAADRLAQAVRVVEVLTSPTAAPTVLLGDMNAGPDALAVRTLTATFTDAWAAAGRPAGERPGDGAEGLTFDAATPHARIDYVLTSGPVRPRAAWVVPTDASDHRPVVADLVI